MRHGISFSRITISPRAWNRRKRSTADAVTFSLCGAVAYSWNCHRTWRGALPATEGSVGDHIATIICTATSFKELYGQEAFVAVGKPVARLPPHRSLREVFPHKAPRSGSLPCQKMLFPDLLFPTVRLAPVFRHGMFGRSFLCGLRPSVPPFPMWKSFSPSEYYEGIRHPKAWTFPFQGTPLMFSSHTQTRQFPGLPRFLSVSLRTCHSIRWTPPVLHILALTGRLNDHPCSQSGCSCVGFGVRENPRRLKLFDFEALSSFGESRPPYGLHDSLCTLRLSCSPEKNPDSAIDATLDTSGWLNLTRQGLAPCKTHQASPGALTLTIKSRFRAMTGRT